MRWQALLCILGLVLLAGCASSPEKKTTTTDNQNGWDDAKARDPRFDHESKPNPALLNDACALLTARPHWAEALRSARKQWQIDPWYILAFMHQESSFNPTALSKSQAYGYAQVKQPTWEWYQLKRGRHNVSRDRFDDAVDFIGWYAHQNVARNKVNLHDVRSQYLAYHEGLGGFESGSYIAKPWLLSISDKVVDRAAMYQAQLLTCPW